MIGKTVEVIAFEIEKDSESIIADSTLKDIQKKYLKYPSISHENYQFNRDEAHDNE